MAFGVVAGNGHKKLVHACVDQFIGIVCTSKMHPVGLNADMLETRRFRLAGDVREVATQGDFRTCQDKPLPAVSLGLIVTNSVQRFV